MSARRLRVATATLALFAAPAAADAQLANPLPQAVGMGGNYTALARGFGAISWNPAGLGMPDNPRFSLALLPLVTTAGLDPVTPSHFAEYDGQVIPEEVKREWLQLIRDAGGEAGSLAADVTYLAFSIGRIGIQASTNVRSRVNVAPDVAEVFLFGNGGFSGEPGTYDLAGSNFDIAGTSAVAASFAVPLSLRLGPLPDQHFSLGATVTYTVGNFLVLGQEESSSISSDPVAVHVRFPMIQTAMAGDTAYFEPADLDNGRGIGLDLGAAWQGGIFSAGVVVRNVINTFEWDLAKLEYRAGQATWTADTSYTSFEEAPVGEAPAALLERIHDLYEFSPVMSAGAAARILPFLTLTGEVRHAVKENLDVGTRNHVGVGAELRILPILPLRAGVSVISGGYQLSAGLGLKLGIMQLSASGAVREAELGSDAVAAFGLTFGAR